jgi:hypothetical protein
MSCRQREIKSDDIQFRVDKDLLGEIFNDSSTQIAIQIPKRWVSIQRKDDSVLRKLKAALSFYSKQVKIKEVFYDTVSNEASLSILDISRWSDADLKQIFKNPDSVFNQAKKWKSINKAEFIYRGIPFFQYILFNENYVNIKLITNGATNSSSKTEFDFILTQKEYKKSGKKVESSIGSIVPN